MRIELEEDAENYTKNDKDLLNKDKGESEDELGNDSLEKKSKFALFFEKPIFKKIGYFWDYYKWFVIIPLIVIIIVLAFLNDYIQENKPRLLDVALVNTYDLSVPYVEIGQNYSIYRGYEDGELPVKISANITYPREMNEELAQDTSLVSNIQKLQSMFLAGNINVMIATDYAVRDFAGADDFLVLTDYLEPEFIEKNKDRLFYAEGSDGTLQPIGFYLEDNEKLGEFTDEEIPVIAICDFMDEEKKMESIEFLKWMMMQY